MILIDNGERRYLQQSRGKGYAGCFLISLLNARIYYNNPYITTLDDPIWEEMVDEYGCRYGGCICRPQAIRNLSLRIKRIDRDEIPNNLPVMISSFTEVGFHSSLVIDCDGDNWTILNYNGRKGEVETVVNKKDINFLKRGNQNDRHYHLYEKNGELK